MAFVNHMTVRASILSIDSSAPCLPAGGTREARLGDVGLVVFDEVRRRATAQAAAVAVC